MKFFKSARVIGWAIAIGFIVVLIMVFNASCQLEPVPTPTPALAPVISGYQMCIARVTADFRTAPNDPQLEVRFASAGRNIASGLTITANGLLTR